MIIRPDGKSYKGGWNKGKQNGEGILTKNTKGESRKGVWLDGTFQKWIQ